MRNPNPKIKTIKIIMILKIAVTPAHQKMDPVRTILTNRASVSSSKKETPTFPVLKRASWPHKNKLPTLRTIILVVLRKQSIPSSRTSKCTNRMRGPSKEWTSKKSTKWKRTERKGLSFAGMEWCRCVFSKLRKKTSFSRSSRTKDRVRPNDIHLIIFSLHKVNMR